MNDNVDRKTKKITRNNMINFRLSDDELRDLANMSYKTDKNQSEVIRKALNMYKNIVDHQ